VAIEKADAEANWRNGQLFGRGLPSTQKNRWPEINERLLWVALSKYRSTMKVPQ
jgi:hypothetical protein